MSEKDCFYINSRGILKSCDVRLDNPVSSVQDLPDLSKIKEYSTVYVCNSAIGNLVTNMNLINHRFILVSGDADEEIWNQAFSSENDFLTFIENDKIIHWFCQNSAISHSKLTNLPIGLDLHTLSGLSNSWGEKKSPVEQEKDILEIEQKNIHFSKRICKCYINFSEPPSSYHYYSDRIEARNEIPQNLCAFEEKNQNRIVSWKNQTQYVFVVSPFGNGMDCIRTWEALVLGCIPIVRSSGMNPLFDDLPVLIVNNWFEVTQKLLDETMESFKHREFKYEKLQLNYWLSKINSYKKQPIEQFVSYQNKEINSMYIFFLFVIILIVFFITLHRQKIYTLLLSFFSFKSFTKRVFGRK